MSDMIQGTATMSNLNLSSRWTIDDRPHWPDQSIIIHELGSRHGVELIGRVHKSNCCRNGIANHTKEVLESALEGVTKLRLTTRELRQGELRVILLHFSATKENVETEDYLSGFGSRQKGDSPGVKS